MMERHAGMLGGLADRAYELACRVQEDAMAAETPAERAVCARAFHDLSRSVRQTLALELRLRRETRRLGREEAAEAATGRKRLTSERKDQLRRRVGALLWTEYEGEDAAEAELELEALIEDAAGDAAFLAEAVEEIAARIKSGLDAHMAQPPLSGAPRGLACPPRQSASGAGPGRASGHAAWRSSG